MTLLSKLTRLLTGRGDDDAPTDVDLAIVRLDPPDGSTLKAGEDIQIVVGWQYSRPRSGIRVWAKPEAADDVGGSYEGDGGEAATPGRGELLRTVSLHAPARLQALQLLARDAHSREVFSRRIPVDYTFVRSLEHEALAQDGLGSRITSVAFEPQPPAVLRPDTRVMVRIGYYARSQHGVRPVAMPVTTHAMTYNGAVETVDGEGKFTQHFTVGEPCTVNQVRVALLNKAGAAVDERLVDVDLRYER